MTDKSRAEVLAAEAWDAVVDGCVARTGEIEVDGRWGHMSARLPAEPTAVACVDAALRAALELNAARGNEPLTGRLDVGEVAAPVRSCGGRPMSAATATSSRCSAPIVLQRKRERLTASRHESAPILLSAPDDERSHDWRHSAP